MGCELSKSAKPKAPKYKTYQTRNIASDAKFLKPTNPVDYLPLNPESDRVAEIEGRKELSVEEEASISCLTELQLDSTKDTMLVEVRDGIVECTPIPADHIFDDDSLPQTGPLEHLDGSMFDDEVLVALVSFEREQMLRKDFEFAAILAHIQGA